jgi:hypothetical protein
MQPHEHHDPEQRKLDPQDKRAMWLLLVIAILLGLITTRPAGSAFLLGTRTRLALVRYALPLRYRPFHDQVDEFERPSRSAALNQVLRRGRRRKEN